MRRRAAAAGGGRRSGAEESSGLPGELKGPAEPSPLAPQPTPRATPRPIRRRAGVTGPFARSGRRQKRLGCAVVGEPSLEAFLELSANLAVSEISPGAQQ